LRANSHETAAAAVRRALHSSVEGRPLRIDLRIALKGDLYISAVLLNSDLYISKVLSKGNYLICNEWSLVVRWCVWVFSFWECSRSLG
jgi:hypothetical protein